MKRVETTLTGSSHSFVGSMNSVFPFPELSRRDAALAREFAIEVELVAESDRVGHRLERHPRGFKQIACAPDAFLSQQRVERSAEVVFDDMAAVGRREIHRFRKIGQPDVLMRMFLKKPPNPTALLLRGSGPIAAEIRVVQDSLTEQLQFERECFTESLPRLWKRFEKSLQLVGDTVRQGRSRCSKYSGIEEQYDRAVAFEWNNKFRNPFPAVMEEWFAQLICRGFDFEHALLVAAAIPAGSVKPPGEAAGMCMHAAAGKERAPVLVEEESATVVERQMDSALRLQCQNPFPQHFLGRVRVDFGKTCHNIPVKNNFL